MGAHSPSVSLQLSRGWAAFCVALRNQLSSLYLHSDISKLDCTGLKIDPFRNRWAYIAVFGLILKWKSHAIASQKDILTFIARIFVNLCKIVEKWPKLRKKIFFSKTFWYGVELLFLLIWAQTQLCRPSGYWVDLWAGRPNLRRFFGRRPISRPKIENFPWTKCFYFSILHTHSKFQASRFNNKKKYPKVADPLKPIRSKRGSSSHDTPAAS